MTTRTDDGITIATRKAERRLNEKQLTHYTTWHATFVEWCLNTGKNIEKKEGFAEATIERTTARTDAFIRFVWREEDGYTLGVTHDHAAAFMNSLLESDRDYSNGHKSNTQKSIKRLFKWLSERGQAERWEPTTTFSTYSNSSAPKEFLTVNERQKIREAALEYGSIPGYNDLSPSDRDRWKAHLAQRFGKSKDEVVPADWDRANGYKFVSLVWTSLDTGLRPAEVEKAKRGWVEVANRRLTIPAKDSVKNDGTWRVSLRDDTTKMLSKWLEERECYEKYDDTDLLWLTRESNPYQTNSLKSLLERLCEQAGIPTEHRKMSWYAIRHSVGTHMSNADDLKSAQSQLRHNSQYTTMKYDQAPEDRRRDALNEMG